MIADPLHEILVLLALLAGYATLATLTWLLFCGANTAAVRALNAAVDARHGAVFSIRSAVERRARGMDCGIAPDLEATLAALVAEQRLPPRLAARLRRIDPVFHGGRWVAYPSTAYWAHRFERMKSR